ncbi:hypothetical protein DFJ73DRAFT_905960 [Zopfochytrium polystomum]|nr:hypothetical protein DFJ73DRAFT_905960 [Zopfochytrium polystomum]
MPSLCGDWFMLGNEIVADDGAAPGSNGSRDTESAPLVESLRSLKKRAPFHASCAAWIDAKLNHRSLPLSVLAEIVRYSAFWDGGHKACPDAANIGATQDKAHAALCLLTSSRSWYLLGRNFAWKQLCWRDDFARVPIESKSKAIEQYGRNNVDWKRLHFTSRRNLPPPDFSHSSNSSNGSSPPARPHHFIRLFRVKVVILHIPLELAPVVNAAFASTIA